MSSRVTAGPRLILAGLSGGSGKTLLSLGLCRLFAQNGEIVSPFKKGPDYIDAAWLTLAAGRQASNLDPFLMDTDQVSALFREKSMGADLALIEGNRGLFDGKDVQGSCSTAELAKLLECPIILVLDCTKMTRTVAAVVLGCAVFDPGLDLHGVILNRTAGGRHRSILRRSVETYTDIPVLGALPKLMPNPIPERHMGLVSHHEYEVDDGLDRLADIFREWLDVAAVLEAARSAPQVKECPQVLWPQQVVGRKVRIGVVKDSVLWFYYRENIEALEKAGAQIIEISLLSESAWPDLDGLYLGGGFPETQAEGLSDNVQIREQIRRMALSGIPVYAECGGLMVLGRHLECGGVRYPMAGIFPFDTDLCAKPQGLGYTQVSVVGENPFFPLGKTFTGHEFHYSRFTAEPGELSFSLSMQRGEGVLGGHDGVVLYNTFASYNQIHALGVPGWAEAFVLAAERARNAVSTGEKIPRIVAGTSGV